MFRSRWLLAVPALVVAYLLAAGAFVIIVLGGAGMFSTRCGLPGYAPGGGGTGTHRSLSRSQLRIARTIVTVAAELGLPKRAAVVGVAAGYVESRLRNVAYGTYDSLGVFQQRAAWGSVAARMDPAIAARMFYLGGRGGQPGLTDHAGWRRMPIGVAAQDVQVSAFPGRYAQWAGLARELTNRFWPAGAPPGGNPAVLAASAGEMTLAATGLLCSGVPAAGPGSWVLPVNGTLSSGFGSRWGGTHSGIDIAGPIGTPIRAASSGTVIAAGPASGYGLWVRIRHGNGIVTEYGHLHQVLVRPGQRVATGQVIGTRGNRGQSTGPHLHFEVQIHGASVDPLPFLAERGVSAPGTAAAAS